MDSFNLHIQPFARVWNKETIESFVELADHGVSYWAVDQSPEEHELPLLFVLTEVEILDGFDSEQTHRVDLATIELGLNRIISGQCEINTDSLGSIAKFITTGDTIHIDIDDADLIVQAGVYGSIKWG